MVQWIGLREILQESPIFNGKIYVDFPLNQSIEWFNQEKNGGCIRLPNMI